LRSFRKGILVPEKFHPVKPSREFFHSSLFRIPGNRPAADARPTGWNHRFAVSAVAGDFFCFSLLTTGATYATIASVMDKRIGYTCSASLLGAGSLYFFFYRAVPAAH
jgi:hypothetical protein